MNNIHIEMDNMAALSCLVKMGGMNNQDLVDLSKQIWNYLIAKQIILTAEHLTGTLNKDADFECGNVKDKGLKQMMKKVTDLGAFCLANSDVVPKIARSDHSKPDSSFKLPRVINESKKGVLFTVTKTIRKTSSMYSFR